MTIGTYSAGTSSQTSQSIISFSSAAETGAGSGHPRSRYVADHVERDGTDLGLVLLGHEALHLVEEEAGGLDARPG